MSQPPIKKPVRRLSRKPARQEAGPLEITSQSKELLTLEHNLVAMDVDQATIERIERLPKDVGWLLFTAGIMGIIVPGVIGTPFLILGGFMIWPWSSQKAEGWLKGHSPKPFKGSIRQINRFLDDLERRYPQSASKR